MGEGAKPAGRALPSLADTLGLRRHTDGTSTFLVEALRCAGDGSVCFATGREGFFFFAPKSRQVARSIIASHLENATEET